MPKTINHTENTFTPKYHDAILTKGFWRMDLRVTDWTFIQTGISISFRNEDAKEMIERLVKSDVQIERIYTGTTDTTVVINDNMMISYKN